MEHPIQGLMDTAMSNIKAMVDVDTVIGDPFTAPDGTVIIPISTVSFGFGAGGSDFTAKSEKAGNDKLFGGGCGGGASVKPKGFLVLSNGNIRFLPLGTPNSPVDKIIDLVPDMIDKLNKFIENAVDSRQKKKEGKNTSSQEEKDAQAEQDCQEKESDKQDDCVIED